MRFQQLVEALAERMHERTADVINLAQNIQDGWELWLQAELWLRLETTTGVLEYRRGVTYPNSTLKCDFMVVAKTSSNIRNWVELKAQKYGQIQETITDFAADIKKIKNLRLDGASNTCGAIVAVPVSAQAVLAYAKILHEIVDLNDVKYFIIGAGGVSGIQQMPNGKKPASADMLVLFYKLL